MTAGVQQKIIQTTGISLSTMLLLILAQGLMQVYAVTLDRTKSLILFLAIFPIVALFSGMVCQYLARSIWSAIVVSTTAFSICLLVMFQPDRQVLIYAPLYVLFSLAGYALAERLGKLSKAK
jgi:hypothetical protein